ncbi:MAG: hypothetical protein WC389_15920 [Lutibacter sp.]|jgi:hypothetical protein
MANAFGIEESKNAFGIVETPNAFGAKESTLEKPTVQQSKYDPNPEIESIIQNRYKAYSDTYSFNESQKQKVMNYAAQGLGATQPIQKPMPKIFENEVETWDWMNKAKNSKEFDERQKFAAPYINAFEANIEPMIDPIEIIGFGLGGGLAKGLKGGIKKVVSNIGKETVSQTTMGGYDIVSSLGKTTFGKISQQIAKKGTKEALQESKQFLDDTMESVYKGFEEIKDSKEMTDVVSKNLNDLNLPVRRVDNITLSVPSPDINQYENMLGKMSTGENTFRQRAGIAGIIADQTSKVKPKEFKGFEKIKGVSSALWDMWKRPPQESDYLKILGEYLGDKQVSDYETSKFAKWIKESIKDNRQVAINNWMEAGGDATKIKEWAGKSGKKFKKGYEEALNLTEQEKMFAADARKFYDLSFDKAMQEGMIDHALENYVNHIYKGDNNVIVKKASSRKLMSEINAGVFRENPSFAKKRFFDSLFDAEQAGMNPEKRIGFNITAYQQAMNEAISTRTTMKRLLEGKAKDGRPLLHPSGYSQPVANTAENSSAYLIKPKGLPEKFSDYRTINHPSLRKWKWLGSQDGKNIMLQGDLVVHPEAYGHLKNVLGKSKITNTAVRLGEDIDVYPGRALLKVSSGFKNTMLSLSPFHQVNIAGHALEHKVIPVGMKALDLADPITRKGINNGLMLFGHNALNEFSEGVFSSGLINKIPGIGALNQKYAGYMWEDWLPRLKQSAFKDIYERNAKRYSKKLSDTQISMLSAKQVNAAFSEQNYKYLGRNPTTQDTLRLMLLAPQFLEDRLKFFGQAMRPYGKEQVTALVRGALGIYLPARIMNMAISGSPHFDKPFSVIVDGKQYSMRTVQGDVIHLVTDPRSFVYHRLNPTISKPFVEWVSGKSQYGAKRTPEEQLADFVKGIQPIPLQGLSDKEQTIMGSALSSIGIPNYPVKKKKGLGVGGL